MPEFTLDFSNIESRSPIRPGKYDVVIDHVEMKQSEGGEYPYFNWKTTIVGGEFEGRDVYLVTSLSPKALWKLQEVFSSFGLEADQVEISTDPTTNMLLTPALDGLPAIATVFNEKYQGRATSKISDLVGVNGEGPQETPVPAAKAPSGPKAAAAQEKVNPFAKADPKRSFK